MRGRLAGPRAGPLRMKVQLHLLPRRQDRFDDAADGREAVDQSGQRIDEEARLEPMPREQIGLIRQPDPARLDRPRPHFGRRQSRDMVPPGELRVDRAEDVRHAARVARGR